MTDKIPVLSLQQYESTRPEGEQKLEFDDCIIRAYVKDGELHILVHRKSATGRGKGHEVLPLGYILGSNALICKLRRA